MAWQGLKLNLRVTQKQILTPGLVQMVSVLALNRLELREMINQEMIANPVLEELSEEPTVSDNYSDETFLKAETEKVPEKKKRIRLMSSMSAVSLTSIWIRAEMAGSRRNAKSASARRSKSFFLLPRDLPITSPGSSASRFVPMPSAKSWKTSSGIWMRTDT